ncbi:hypothetical protein ACFE04_005041 [Oxalis oulophora]
MTRKKVRLAYIGVVPCEVEKVEDFLKDPWVAKVFRKAIVQVFVPMLVVATTPPPPPQQPIALIDGGRGVNVEEDVQVFEDLFKDLQVISESFQRLIQDKNVMMISSLLPSLHSSSMNASFGGYENEQQSGTSFTIHDPIDVDGVSPGIVSFEDLISEQDVQVASDYSQGLIQQLILGH